MDLSEGGFFNVEITDEFVEELADDQFIQLFEILKQNFFQEYRELTKARAKRQEIVEQIKNGDKNIAKLQQIKASHHETHMKNAEAIDKLDEKIKKLKDEWKQL